MRNKEKKSGRVSARPFFFFLLFEFYFPDASLLEDDLSSGIKSIQMKTKSVS